MTVLLFNDRGWEVATSAWSAASKDGQSVEVCYQWGADGISWFDSAKVIPAKKVAAASVMRRINFIFSPPPPCLRPAIAERG